MIAAYHGKTDYCASELLAINPFAPAVQTAARLRGYDGLVSATPKMPPCLQGKRYTLRSQRISITEDKESLSEQD